MTTLQPGSLPRLLAGWGEGPLTLGAHRSLHGAPRRHAPAELVELARAASLRGRGGGGFPLAVKLSALVGRRRGEAAVLLNAVEADPFSYKDAALLGANPHLVLDGAALAARAVGAREVVIAVGSRHRAAALAVGRAIGERPEPLPRFTVHTVPNRYLLGQESALIAHLNGKRGVPSFLAAPYRRGLHGQPTLVANAETIAQLALLAIGGSDWFSAIGEAEEPGSALLTVWSEDGRPAISEVAFGTPLHQIIPVKPGTPLLVGGLAGGWLPGGWPGPWSREALARAGAAVGCGAVATLPADRCPLAETARILAWLAGQGAGQCGPCRFGTRDLALAFGQLCAGERGALELVEEVIALLPGRGACSHPDGTARLAASALRAFPELVKRHGRHGPCPGCATPPAFHQLSTFPAEADGLARQTEAPVGAGR